MRWLLLSYSASLALLGPLRGPGIRADPPDAEFVKIEIHGKLSGGERGPDGRVSPPSIKADAISFLLEYADPPPQPHRIEELHGRAVVARGTLKMDDRGRLVCRVEGEVEEDRPAIVATQFLVGYHDDPAGLQALGRSLGLRIVGRNEPGKFLIVETSGDTDPTFLEKLKGNKAVRYVERNMKYQIPEK